MLANRDDQSGCVGALAACRAHGAVRRVHGMLPVLALRDRMCIGFSQLAIVLITFHYFQYMASSPAVLWSSAAWWAKA